MNITQGDETIAHWLEEQLLASLGDTNVQAVNSNILLTAKDSHDRIIGGLVGSTSYGWLLVKILWVDHQLRGTGVGRSLMEQAESIAVTRDCHGAWLDTSSPDAHAFYLKIGFEAFGKLHNEGQQIPVGHQRWFMKKALLVEVS